MDDLEVPTTTVAMNSVLRPPGVQPSNSGSSAGFQPTTTAYPTLITFDTPPSASETPNEAITIIALQGVLRYLPEIIGWMAPEYIALCRMVLNRMCRFRYWTSANLPN